MVLLDSPTVRVLGLPTALFLSRLLYSATLETTKRRISRTPTVKPLVLEGAAFIFLSFWMFLYSCKTNSTANFIMAGIQKPLRSRGLIEKRGKFLCFRVTKILTIHARAAHLNQADLSFEKPSFDHTKLSLNYLLHIYSPGRFGKTHKKHASY